MMTTLYIQHPEQPLIFQDILSYGYYYKPQLENIDRYSSKHGGAYCLQSLERIPVWDLRRLIYSRYLSPIAFVSKKEKEEIKSLVEKNNELSKKVECYTDELADNIYKKQNIENVESIRSLDEIKKSFDLPRSIYNKEIEDTQKIINLKLIEINNRYINKLNLSKEKLEKDIRGSFDAISFYNLPSFQVDRLVRIWINMHEVVSSYMNNNLFGDELGFYNII